MRAFGPSPKNLGGHLLLAHPALRDPNFRRSIIVLGTHDAADGAMGWVVNRPLGKQVRDFPLDEAVTAGLESLPVLLGGPVQLDRLVYASFRWDEGRFLCRPHLEAEEARELAKDPAESVQAFIGYAGWTSGQLEMEMRRSSWVAQPAESDFWQKLRHEDLWRGTVRKISPVLRMLADAPDDSSRN